jgi:hypothetical protein
MIAKKCSIHECLRVHAQTAPAPPFFGEEARFAAPQTRLDPYEPFQYVPATLDRTDGCGEPIDQSRRFDWACIWSARLYSDGVSAGRRATKLARMPAEEHGAKASQAARRTRKRAAPSNRSRKCAASAAPLGPVVFGGFFCARMSHEAEAQARFSAHKAEAQARGSSRHNRPVAQLAATRRIR